MKNRVLLLVFLFVFNVHSQVVSNNAELQTAIANATAGTTIILSNGVWNNTVININKVGNATNPITIKAQNAGQVSLEGKPQISLGGKYIVFEGFVFKNPLSLVSSGGTIEPIIEFRDASNNECNNCKVTNIKIEKFNGTSLQSTDVFKWIIVYGQYNEISHSTFIGKYGIGSIINDNRSDSSNADYTRIHHNYFAERTPVGVLNDLNDQDAIRIGWSGSSLSDSYTEVYDNYFHKWSGEIEIISNKSGKNKYYNNTFRDYNGTLTLRHGNGCEVFNNYFFASNYLMSGGIRVIGEDHKVYNNYIEGVNSTKPDNSKTNTTGGINVSNGKPSSALNEYYQVKNAIITNNTFVNCDYGIRIGTKVKSDLTLAPENVIIANNIMLNSSDGAVSITTAPIGTSEIIGNMTQNGSWDLTNGVNNNQTVSSGLLASGTEFYRLPAASAAIDAQVSTFSFLANDILKSTRTAPFDRGAEEYGGTGTNLPYKFGDVGFKIGFLSSPSPYISLSTNTLEFNKTTSNKNFDISSNVNWVVSDDASWVTLSPTSGSNGGVITVNVLENTTGLDRTATITVSQNGGSISSVLTVNQSSGVFNPNIAEKITGLTVTGEGTQEGGVNIPENTIDGNTATRWSGDSTTGSAYLTYNLQCPKIVTSVKIQFLNGNTRTSSFKIATSTDGTNFTDATAILTSSGTSTGLETFPLTPNQTVQYVRVLGYGNSSPSGWNSYQEVEIHGDNTCSSLSVDNAISKSNKLVVYPVPTSDGYIMLKSEINTIGTIKIYDILGKLLHSQNIASNAAKIDVNFLSKGVYILKTDTTTKRILVN